MVKAKLDFKALNQTDILQVVADSGLSLVKNGHYYTTKEHDSLVIVPWKNRFYWFSRDVRGGPIDFLQEQKGLSAYEAALYLQEHTLGKRVVVSETKQEESKPFVYPFQKLEHRLSEEAKTFLTEVRGLQPSTIAFFEEAGALVETPYRARSDDLMEPVLAFKFYDYRHRICGASLQGIRKTKERQDRAYLKKILYRSDGHLGMSVDIGQPKRLVFCEAPLDAMAYYECHRDSLQDVRLVSMDGLKSTLIKRQVLQLVCELNGQADFLEGLEPADYERKFQALLQTTFFVQHPSFITLAVDNDKAGRAFVERLTKAKIPVTAHLPPLKTGDEKMDWNDYLKQTKTSFRQEVTNPDEPKRLNLEEVIALARKKLADQQTTTQKTIERNFDSWQKITTLY